ncbi:hypothetical protein JCM37172_10150 [Faecalimonas hominis]
MPPFLEIGDVMLVYLEMLETPEEKLKFEQLYFLYRDKMYAVAFKILHNENDAEDIVHESFKAIIENFEKINDISCHKTWNYIVTIVKNKSFTLYQKKKHHETSAYEDWVEVKMDFTPEKVTEEREIAEILAELIRSLPFPYKEVLYLQYYNALSGEEIAKFIDKTPAHVRKISQRAKAMLKEELLKRGIQNE